MDIWAVTVAARRSILETYETLGETLDETAWDRPTLCDAWTVRQMLGHLIVAAKPPKRRFARALIRARGDFDRANVAIAVDEATKTPAELTRTYRSVIEHRFAPPGWPKAAPLSDVLLHTLDVRIPLGLPTEEPPAHYEPTMGLLFTRVGQSFSASERPAVRWVATDHDWSHGDGPEVRATMQDLVLAAAGRTARLDALDGDGADAVRRALT